MTGVLGKLHRLGHESFGASAMVVRVESLACQHLEDALPKVSSSYQLPANKQ